MWKSTKRKQYLDIKTKYRSGEIVVVDLLNQCI